MFTRNWYVTMAAMIKYADIQDAVNYKGAKGVSAVALSNAAYCSFLLAHKYDSTNYVSLWYLRTSINEKSGVILGTGSTPPTLDDYCLAGNIISGYTYSANVNTSYDDTGMTCVALYTITNDNDSSITINEIGLIGNNKNSSGNTSSEYKILLERTVLDEPVTIPAGGVGQVTYTIRMNYPNVYNNVAEVGA